MDSWQGNSDETRTALWFCCFYFTSKKKLKGFQNAHNKCLSRCEGLAGRYNIFDLGHHCICTLTAQDFIHPDLEYFLEGQKLTASPESFFHCSDALRMEKFLPTSSQTLSSSNSFVIPDLDSSWSTTCRFWNMTFRLRSLFRKRKGKGSTWTFPATDTFSWQGHQGPHSS